MAARRCNGVIPDCWWRVAGFGAVLAIVGVPLIVAPKAFAGADLNVGMAIDIGRHRCTLGFFGINERDDRLAVTAGHCSDQVPNQAVYAGNGVQIGEVVAWKPDDEDGRGNLTGSRGYTVFVVYDQFSLDPFFTDVSRGISEGDYVSKYGQRTKKTNGVIENVSYVKDRPDLAVMWSDMVQLPGDSGCAWYTTGPTIVGMGSSGDQESEGGGAGSQAQPIGAVIDMIRLNPTVWGNNFKVWTT
ncbi:hypothetical protein [Mycolicibacterium wolinskyi]|uniref:hypothetical protein n=1 Tax=Mycolicibacterium wolinskyi TaxID=59750 RepID=UPI003BA8B596